MPFFIKIKQMGKTTFLKIISIIFLVMFVFLEVPILTKSSFLVNLLVLLGFKTAIFLLQFFQIVG